MIDSNDAYKNLMNMNKTPQLEFESEEKRILNQTNDAIDFIKNKINDINARKHANDLFNNPPPNFSQSLMEWRRLLSAEYPEEAKIYINDQLDQIFKELLLDLKDDEGLLFCIYPESSWDINSNNCFAVKIKAEPGLPKSERVKVFKDVVPTHCGTSYDNSSIENFSMDFEFRCDQYPLNNDNIKKHAEQLLEYSKNNQSSLDENSAYKNLMSSQTEYTLADDFTNATIDWEKALDRMQNTNLFDNPPPNYPYSLIEWRKYMQQENPRDARRYMFNKIKSLYQAATGYITDYKSIIFCISPIDAWDINSDNCHIFEYDGIGGKIEIFADVEDMDSIQFSFVDDLQMRYTKIDSIDYFERYMEV